jgi:hypothetical protein
MTLIVYDKRNKNAGYNGRFKEEAARLVRSGVRVGMVHLSRDDAKWFCHVCSTHQPAPPVEPGAVDAMAPCPSCKTPFVFDLIFERK